MAFKLGNTGIKEWLLLDIPLIRYFYARLRNRNLWRTMQVEKWVRKSMDFLSKYEVNDFTFRQKRAYVVTKAECELIYVPGRPYTALGLELNGNEFETGELEVLLSLVAYAKSAVLDIGANCGYYSIAIAKKYPNVRIHAFEPIPETFESLEHNLRHNKVAERVKCNKIAIGEKKGAVTMTSTLNTGNYVIPGESSKCPRKTITATMTTVDEYVSRLNLPLIDGIKCDIEGAELFMLRGASMCLNRDHPWLLLEIEERWTRRQGYMPGEVFVYLQQKGYSGFLITRSDVRLIPITSLEIGSKEGNNYLFIDGRFSSSEMLTIIKNLTKRE